MGTLSELRKLRAVAKEPPPREDMHGVLDSVEGQLGYRYGWHHAMDEAIEIAEENEEADD